MKWLCILLISSLLFLNMPSVSGAITAEEYALQVIQKDLPRSLRWFERLSALSLAATTSPVNPVEIQELYQSALPVTQPNLHSGISIKGSIERMLLLLEGARIFESVQTTSSEFQSKMHKVMTVLLAAKDQTDHFKFGEKSEFLFQQWQQQVGMTDYASFAQDLEHVLSHVQKLLAVPESNTTSIETVQTGDGPASDMTVENVMAGESEFGVAAADSEQSPVPPMPLPSMESFDVQRFFAYVEASERGRVSSECEAARRWSTETTLRCESDSQPGCDRSYARQCKKLH